jgi:aryl-alcohol dehydrogenase-like predicted oxidoreductase
VYEEKATIILVVGEMVNNPLGSTGIEVSPLCFGTLPFSPLQGARPGAEETLERAFELGVNFIDTAQLYDNYAVLRTKRDTVVASKTYACTWEGAAEAVEEARRGLERDVIDIFLLHEQESGHTLRGHAPALDMLYKLKAQGVIRAVGLSTHHVSGVRAAIEAELDVVHPLLNIAGLGIADGGCAEMEEAVAGAVAAGLGVYVMKALGGGHLHGRAQEAIEYASRRGHSLALGMRDTAEVEAAVKFFETGILPEIGGHAPRMLHIADWCGGCGKCVEKCANKALTVEGGKALCSCADCLLCGYCGAACPDFCIKII